MNFDPLLDRLADREREITQEAQHLRAQVDQLTARLAESAGAGAPADHP